MGQWRDEYTLDFGDSTTCLRRTGFNKLAVQSVGGDNGTIEMASIASALSVGDAAPSTTRLIHAQLTLNYQGSVSLSGSVVALRGITTIDTGTEFAGGYAYGAQGKLAVKGTLSSGAEVSCGLIGQLDFSAATDVTGPTAAIWADCGATMSSGIGASKSNIDGVVIYNTTGTKINAALRIDTNSDYLMDITDEGGGHGSGNWIDAGTGATAACNGHIKINVNGTAKYLRLYGSTS